MLVLILLRRWRARKPAKLARLERQRADTKAGHLSKHAETARPTMARQGRTRGEARKNPPAATGPAGRARRGRGQNNAGRWRQTPFAPARRSEDQRGSTDQRPPARSLVQHPNAFL